MVTHHGGCHCGKIAFEVDVDGGAAVECNCSICTKRGSLLWFAPRDKFRLLSGQDDLTTYTFNKNVIQHQFCKHCGVQSFALGEDPRGNKMAAINIRCLEAFEFDQVPVKQIDGRAF
jgi:hypothetical protein